MSTPRESSVAHYTGHMFAAGPEQALRDRIIEVLRERDVGAVFGSLACGSDLLVAESCLALDIEVHATLPCDTNAFIERSVRPGGQDWVRRFDAARACVSSLVVAPTVADTDESMFARADRLAIELALTRAARLGSPVFQIALWDRAPGDGDAGTGASVGRWRHSGHPTIVIELARDALTPVARSARSDTL